MKILAVDDDSYILELIPLVAEQAGFPDVKTAASGDAALGMLECGDIVFDCLLVDINMPGMDGIELCARARELEAYRSAPIIMLTAMSERVYMERAFKAGATDYATKPFDVNEMEARLRVARELIVARRAACVARLSSDISTHPSIKAHAFDISDAIFIDGVKDLIGFESAKNYLRQSTRAGLAASQVMAVKIDGVKYIYDRARTEEFIYALSEVALAVIELVRRYGGLISYAGSGLFLVISSSSVQLDSRELESEVQTLLDEKNSEYDDGTPMVLEVSIGNPIQPSFGDFRGVSRTLERAIARAESRSETKGDQPCPVNIRRLRDY